MTGKERKTIRKLLRKHFGIRARRGRSLAPFLSAAAKGWKK
jgi:hypothetical protein